MKIEKQREVESIVRDILENAFSWREDGDRNEPINLVPSGEDDQTCLKNGPTNMEEPSDKESGVREVCDDDPNNSQNNDQSSLQEYYVVMPNTEVAKPRPKVRKSKPMKQTHQFNLAYFSLWWKRMEREGERDQADSLIEKERMRNSLNMKNFLARNKSLNNNTHTNSLNLAKNVKSDDECLDVVHARPPYVLKECHPSKSSPNILSGLEVGEGVRGSKRILSDRLDSPSKRLRNFNTLLTFWGNPTGVVQESNLRNRPKSHVNTTQPDSTETIMPNSAKLVTEPADLLRNDSESFQDEGDPTNRGFRKNGFSPDGF